MITVFEGLTECLEQFSGSFRKDLQIIFGEREEVMTQK